MQTPRVAIVHEWLITYAGSEKVLETMLEVFPEADIFCALDFLPEQFRAKLSKSKIRTSFIQKLPFARRLHRYFLALMPLAVEQHDLSAYDIVISNSHAVAKGCITNAGQLHICYCYTPIRYAWDLQFQYLKSRICFGDCAASLPDGFCTRYESGMLEHRLRSTPSLLVRTT